MAPPSRSPALDSNQESKPSNQERPPPRSTPRLKKNGRTQCYYESLGVERNVGEDELKQAYRKLAMQWHPDKNADNVEEATEMFKVIQNAYSVLSDPNERSWYDRHREQILRGAGPSDDCSDDEDIDLFPYFSASAFKGFGDDEGGFYATYADVFAEIDNLEREQGEDDEDTPTRARGRGREVAPGFGTSTSEWPEVRDFYNHWLGFSTRRPMYSHDKWDLREAPNRFMRRAMEKENKKERQGARREYSAQVRQLVEFVRKRDRRVQAHNERVDTETREREAAMRAKRAEEQRAYDAERSRVAAELAAEDDEEMVQLLEAAAANLGLGPRGKRGKKGGNGGGSGSGQGGGAPSGAAADAAGADGGVAGGEEADPAMLYCPACNKDFRSLAQLQNHERSKKHLEKAAELRAYLETLGEGEEEEGGRESEQEEEEDGYQEDVEDKADDDEEEEEEEEETEEQEEQQQEEDAAKPSGASRAGGDAAADASAASAAGRAPAEQRSSDESAAASDSDDASAMQARAARRLARKQHVAFAEEDGDEGAELFSHLTLGGSRRGRALAGGGGVHVARVPSAPSADGGTDGEPTAAPTNGRAKARRRAKRAEVRSGDEPPAPAPAPASSGEDGMVGGGKAARKQKKGKAAAAGEDEQDFECKSCGQQFSTRNKLFQHIKTDCHPAQLAALRKQK